VLSLANTKARNKKEATETKRKKRIERERREANTVSNPVSPAAMAPVMIKVTAAEWEKLLKEIKDLQTEVDGKVVIIKNLHKEADKTLKETAILQGSIDEKEAIIVGGKKLIKEMTEEKEKQARVIETKDKKIKELTEALKKALAALKEKGKHSKAEESKAVLDGIDDWIKKVGYREWKFAQDDKLTEFTEECYEGIKEKLGMTEVNTDNSKSLKEFKRIYRTHCGKQLGARRQFNQTQILKAAHGKYPKLTDNGAKTEHNLHFINELVPLQFGTRSTKLCQQSRNWKTSIRFLL
jgi:hypothetical protein